MILSPFYWNRHLIWSDEKLGRFHYSTEARIEKKLSAYIKPGQKVLKYCSDDLCFTDEPDHSYDVIILVHTLNHVPHRTELLKEIHRLLIPGGLLLTSTDCLGEPMCKDALRQWFGERSVKDPIFFYDTFRSLRQLIESTGFSTLESEELCAGMPHLFLASRKLMKDAR